MNKLLIIGAGGFATLGIDALYGNDSFSDIALLDDNKVGQEVFGYPVIGKIDQLENCRKNFSHAIVTIGNGPLRLRLIERLEQAGYEIASIINKSAYISNYAKLGKNMLVFAGAIINPGTTIGTGVIINTAAVVEHDNVIGDGVHISPNACTCGEVKIGNNSWVCTGSSIGPRLTIGEHCIVAAGSSVIRDVEDWSMVTGSPAAFKKSLKDN